jgi:hypothetical protein
MLCEFRPTRPKPEALQRPGTPDGGEPVQSRRASGRPSSRPEGPDSDGSESIPGQSGIAGDRGIARLRVGVGRNPRLDAPSGKKCDDGVRHGAESRLPRLQCSVHRWPGQRRSVESFPHGPPRWSTEGGPICPDHGRSETAPKANEQATIRSLDLRLFCPKISALPRLWPGCGMPQLEPLIESYARRSAHANTRILGTRSEL